MRLTTTIGMAVCFEVHSSLVKNNWSNLALGGLQMIVDEGGAKIRFNFVGLYSLILCGW